MRMSDNNVGLNLRYRGSLQRKIKAATGGVGSSSNGDQVLLLSGTPKPQTLDPKQLLLTPYNLGFRV
jgi:hypothetical protein